MGELGEREPESVLRAKLACTDRAIGVVEKEMSEHRIFTAKEALDLGVRYVAYHREYWTHILLMAADNVGSGKISADSAVNPLVREERTKTEEALSDAQNGNFVKLKNYLKQRGNSVKRRMGGEFERQSKKEGPKLRYISALIPNSGDPIDTPAPSWQDSRYS